MDRLEFLVEEESMAEILKVLLPQILSDSWKLNENYFRDCRKKNKTL